MSFSGAIRTLSTILPEVPKPQRKLSLTERLIWSALAVAIYLIMAETPLFGVQVGPFDPFGYARVIFASSQGTLMELGIGPIVTAGLIMQLLKGSEIIKLDFKKPEDRALFTSATKLFTMVVILMEAMALHAGGAFGVGSSTTTLIIILQLFVAGIIVVLLDETMQKGWGLGSGISLFILAGVAQQIMWNIFSPLPVTVGEEASSQTVPFGFLPFLISASMRGAAHEAIMRPFGYPSLFAFLLTIIVILIIVYVEGMRVEVPITSVRFRGFAGVYPIKLLYTSVVPVILASALLTTITFFSQFIWSSYNRLSDNPWLNWIGTFDPNGPTGGLVYYMTSPRSLDVAMADPLRALTFVISMVILATLFSKLWVELGGLAPKQVAKSLIDAKVHVPGFRTAGTSIEAVLGKYIPPLTIISGICIGLLASIPDLLGVFGSGTGILLMVGIIMQYYQILVREQVETMLPRLAGLLGRK